MYDHLHDWLAQLWSLEWLRDIDIIPGMTGGKDTMVLAWLRDRDKITYMTGGQSYDHSQDWGTDIRSLAWLRDRDTITCMMRDRDTITCMTKEQRYDRTIIGHCRSSTALINNHPYHVLDILIIINCMTELPWAAWQKKCGMNESLTWTIVQLCNVQQGELILKRILLANSNILQ
jgi:hypothetical protein